MSLSLPETHKLPASSTPAGRFALLRSWSLWWEVGVVLLVGAFLRFYQIQTTEFDEDQAMLFRMASDAVHHGLLPTTSNAASIGIANPPGVIYLFMLPAALSANPLWGTVMVGLFTIAAIVLTYFFTRRYYGRLAGIIAALLYATAAKPLNYARFIWQPNLMPPFVILFVFVLFLGVVERRKGWLLPALLLLGILYQMHAITLLLVFPLLCALVLAPGTLRWRDVGLAVVLLAIIFFPYLLWESFTHFADLQTVFSLAKHPAHIDRQALDFYIYFLSPFDHQPTYTGSALFALAPWLGWLRLVMVLLVLSGFALAGMLLLFPSGKQAMAPGTENAEAASVAGGVRGWWQALRADPTRCGLAVLLVWQLVPLLILTRHSIDLHSQYFFMFMPGPFILIALLIAKVVAFSQARRAGAEGVDTDAARLSDPWLAPRQGALLRYSMYALVVLVIGTQLVGSTAAVIDTSSGGFSDRSFQPYPYHNALNSLQNALTSADQLAQQRHLNRVYITVDRATRSAISYLSAFMRTPTTLFDAPRCLVLPGPTSGPALLLVGPYDTLTNALLGWFAAARPVAQLPRVGGPPFSLYEVSPGPQQATSSSTSAFVHELQPLSARTVALNGGKAPWLVTRWTMLRDAQPALHTTYNYTVSATPLSAGGVQQSMQNPCTFTALRAGDQFLAAFNLPAGGVRAVSLGAQSSVTQPYNPVYGPFHLETDASNTTPWTTLRTESGQESITVTVS
ncbi:MAG: glycosyltransferase family 39 protein [Ktedonobacteraceae bacterium]|nr:glycosyltransferase family 39 protein [Ktedonobacteraceae bacterium]